MVTLLTIDAWINERRQNNTLGRISHTDLDREWPRKWDCPGGKKANSGHGRCPSKINQNNFRDSDGQVRHGVLQFQAGFAGRRVQALHVRDGAVRDTDNQFPSLGSTEIADGFFESVYDGLFFRNGNLVADNRRCVAVIRRSDRAWAAHHAGLEFAFTCPL